MNYSTNNPKSFFTETARTALQRLCILEPEVYFHDMARGVYTSSQVWSPNNTTSGVNDDAVYAGTPNELKAMPCVAEKFLTLGNKIAGTNNLMIRKGARTHISHPSMGR